MLGQHLNLNSIHYYDYDYPINYELFMNYL